MWTQIPYSARIGLSVRQYIGEAARKLILPPRKNTDRKKRKKSTERYGIPNFRRFRKSLATSSPRSETNCCALAKQCGTVQDQAQDTINYPQRKDYKSQQTTKYNQLHCEVGPIKQQLERGPQFSPIMYRRV